MTISLKEQKIKFSLLHPSPTLLIAFDLENKANGIKGMFCAYSGLPVGLIVKAIYPLIIFCILCILVILCVDARAKTLLCEGGLREHCFDEVKRHSLLKRAVRT